jgi:hypothetical protein
VKNELVGDNEDDDEDFTCPGINGPPRGLVTPTPIPIPELLTKARPELGRERPAPEGEGECRVPEVEVESGGRGRESLVMPPEEPIEPATMPPEGDWRTGRGRGIPRDPGVILGCCCCGWGGVRWGDEEEEEGFGFGRRKRSARVVERGEEDEGEWEWEWEWEWRGGEVEVERWIESRLWFLIRVGKNGCSSADKKREDNKDSSSSIWKDGVVR